MFDKARSFAASHRDASDAVKQAQGFAVRLPLVGRITVPPPDQLAFYGVLGGLVALGAIEWPVAAAIGVGQAVVSRHFGDKPAGEEQRPARAPAVETTPAKAAVSSAPAKKAPAKKAAAKKAPAKKAAAKKAPAKKSPAKKAPAKKASS
ncbi:hypothetical protein [Mycolicibacterium parafortuitum]|uniref:Uncharacterized protein n=1 Tax=Mycolicibacterium parafortuitum TaxID=39692 RepID=A0A375YHJ5_MYCPF|nr:hypothetical protein [Mycolicibacterium parafortuitum]SRX80588.1 hypothetical protein MPP7335_02331 [Mycolicibacterium parafortuitum]